MGDIKRPAVEDHLTLSGLDHHRWSDREVDGATYKGLLQREESPEFKELLAMAREQGLELTAVVDDDYSQGMATTGKGSKAYLSDVTMDSAGDEAESAKRFGKLAGKIAGKIISNLKGIHPSKLLYEIQRISADDGDGFMDIDEINISPLKISWRGVNFVAIDDKLSGDDGEDLLNPDEEFFNDLRGRVTELVSGYVRENLVLEIEGKGPRGGKAPAWISRNFAISGVNVQFSCRNVCENYVSVDLSMQLGNYYDQAIRQSGRTVTPHIVSAKWKGEGDEA
ncbi:MAG: hypothetical protein WCT36_03040 [Candidatus Gracilibacteria bacterium]